MLFLLLRGWKCRSKWSWQNWDFIPLYQQKVSVQTLRSHSHHCFPKSLFPLMPPFPMGPAASELHL